MTYDVLIRHSVPTAEGEGAKHHMSYRHVEAASEEEAYLKTRRSLTDHIACIDAWHHCGVTPFSVETGEPDFFTDAHRPTLAIEAGAQRMG